MKILLAEDDPITRKLLQKTLEEWGYEVLSAGDGQAAYEIFIKEHVKFVLADWLMPVMDGLTLCRLIRSSKDIGYVYFIILTGMGKKEDIIKGLSIGADDYVIKPFDRDELKVRVKTGERILTLEKQLTENNEMLQKLNLKLEELVRLDVLMQIGNRLSFYETIEKVHHRAGRYGQEYGIIMCDIDHFKLCNDSYGHLAGDNILRQISEAIKGAIRKSDEVFRYGGEELVIILPNQDKHNSITVAEKVRQRIAALNIENKGTESGIVTISCGVAAFDRDASENKWEVILDQADQALYRAKNSGRNKVSAYDNTTL